MSYLRQVKEIKYTKIVDQIPIFGKKYTRGVTGIFGLVRYRVSALVQPEINK